MIILPLSCTCSDLKVFPKNWMSAKVSIKKDWYVYYRFYDPVFKENPTYKKGKLIVIKGMNQFKTIVERQKETQRIIEKELEKLKNGGFNPISNKYNERTTSQLILEPSTSFISAITLAEKRISVAQSTKREFKSALKFVIIDANLTIYKVLMIGRCLFYFVYFETS